ncbi:MAG: porin, partial [Gammaproteobacteria bacterium]
MNKIRKTVLLATLALPFLAVASEAGGGNTTLYGQARLSIDSVDNGTDRVTQIADTESRLGIKGFENLGNGLKAVFQLEVAVNLEDGAGTTGTLFARGRNSFIGLESSLGTVALGLYNSPYRETTDKIDVFGSSLADHNTIISNVGNGNTAAEFNLREPNTINYWSPKFNGLQINGQYRLDEIDGINQDHYSVGGIYENGPWYAGIGYEVHGNEGSLIDADGAGPLPAVGTNDTKSFKAGVAYVFNNDKTRVGFVYDTISEADADTIFDRDAYYVNLSHKLDNNVFKVGYAHANDSDAAVGDDGADFYFAGLSHNLSKHTEVYAQYAATDNEDNGRFGLGNSTTANTA